MSKCYLVMLFFVLSTAANAIGCVECNDYYWELSGSFGVTQYQNAYANDGKSIIGRLSFGAQYRVNHNVHLGLESGIQNGNSMRLDIPKPILDIVGGEPVKVFIKPSVDVLATVKLIPFYTRFFGFLKGGIAYRQLQVDRNEVNDISQLTPEVQAGLGYEFGDNSYVHVGYQQLFGKNINYHVDPLTEIGHIENIPRQGSLFIGVSILFGNQYQ